MLIQRKHLLLLNKSRLAILIVFTPVLFNNIIYYLFQLKPINDIRLFSFFVFYCNLCIDNNIFILNFNLCFLDIISYIWITFSYVYELS